MIEATHDALPDKSTPATSMQLRSAAAGQDGPTVAVTTSITQCLVVVQYIIIIREHRSS